MSPVPLRRTRLLALIVSACAFFGWICAPSASAGEDENRIQDLAIVAEIQPDGSAIITDTRTFTAVSGTEHYISLGNLGPSTVEGFVVELDGQRLTNVDDWDIDASLEEKAGKSGILQTDIGYDLCFGFGSYGQHEVTMMYTVTDFVKQLNDGTQAIYWEFLPKNSTPTDNATVYVTDSQGYQFDDATTKIWGFGYHGESAIDPDALSLTAEGGTSESDHLVMLAEFLEAPFTAPHSLDMSATDLEEKAKDGSVWEEGMIESLKNLWATDKLGFIKAVGAMALVGFSVLLGVLGVIYGALSNAKTNKVSAKRDDPWKPNSFRSHAGKGDYYRELPYNGPLSDIASMVGSTMPGLLNAYMLGWIRSGRMVMVPNPDPKKHKPKYQSWQFTDTGQPFENSFEEQMWNLLFYKDSDPKKSKKQKRLEKATQANVTLGQPDGFAPTTGAYSGEASAASSRTKLLTTADFESIATRQHEKMKRWAQEVKAHSEQCVEAHGWTRIEEKRVYMSKIDALVITDAGQQFVDNVKGLQNYLTDFSLLAEREAVQVNLWGEYFRWAAFLGIADEVRSQLLKVAPKLGDSLDGIDLNMLYYVTFVSSHFDSEVRSAQSAAARAASGGGGSSSWGGGGGSFGGGSGGGIR